MPLYMVFDVESVGLHGEGFAVGAVVVNERGDELDRLYAACPSVLADGGLEGRKWLDEHLPPLMAMQHSPHEVREEFWKFWLQVKQQGAILCADCPWPVEARFLIQCIDDGIDVVAGPAGIDVRSRDWDGPYPLIDVASVRLAAGYDPLATEPRLDSELPIHDPLADARQSARLLIEALTACGEALSSLEVMHG